MSDLRDKTENPYWTSLQGQAGVWAVASQLALRGHVPLFPGVDYGYDIKLENGLRIQVKSARLRHSHPAYPTGVYCFDWRNYQWHSMSKRHRAAKDYSVVADFFACWGVDENRFWIFPCTNVQRAVWFPKEKNSPWVDREEVSKLRSEGMTYQSIADKFGVSYTAIRNAALRLSEFENSETSSRRLREYENRWDLLDIDRAVKTMVEDVPIPTEVPAFKEI